MRSATAWVAMLTAAVAGASFAGGKADFSERLEFVEGVRLGRAFEHVAVKTDRPMPWPAFVDYLYRTFKGSGKVEESDLGANADATIWLAVLDEEYRTKGRLIFVKGGKVPGVANDRWLSLEEFESKIMPHVVHTPEAFEGGEVEKAVRELVDKGAALHELPLSRLLLVPREAEAGWRRLEPEGRTWATARKLNEAYAARDAEAMRRAAKALAASLVMQPGYPSAAKLSLEIYLRKLAVLKIGFALYVLSALFFFVWAAVGKRGLADAGAWVAFAGFVLMTAGLVGRSVIAGHLPTTSMYEYLVFFSWTAVLFFLLFYLKTRGAFIGVIVMPVAFLLVVLASLFPADIEAQLIPALQSWWLTIHVVLACLGEGAFAVAFAAAVLRLFRSDRPSGRLPPKERLEVIEYRAVALGYPLFTIGALVAGAIWAQKAWSIWWSWDPKETASLVVFLIATAYLHARHARGWRGTRAAALAVLIFVAAVFTLFANLIFGGLHSYGP
jgi:cytochrome c-type biogenesis protein CcsB